MSLIENGKFFGWDEWPDEYVNALGVPKRMMGTPDVNEFLTKLRTLMHITETGERNDEDGRMDCRDNVLPIRGDDADTHD